MKKKPLFGESSEALPAAPDGDDSRFSVSFSREKSTEPRDPARGFANRRNVFRQLSGFLRHAVKSFPLVTLQNCKGRIQREPFSPFWRGPGPVLTCTQSFLDFRSLSDTLDM